MYTLLMALLIAGVGVIPLLVARVFIGAAVTAGISFLASWFLLYIIVPSLVWPLGGIVGVFILIMWIISAIISFAIDSERAKYSLIFPIVGASIYMCVGGSGCSCFRADDYAKLIGSFEQREWTQDVQPADPKHIRLVPEELALFLADKQLAQAPGAIGSQFQLDKKGAVLQRVQGQLWWVIPLDYKGFRAWQATDSAPGYMMVHGDDPNYSPVLKYQEKFVYTPGAYFSKNLTRHLWMNGYIFKGLTDYMLEVDENGKAWWVVTVFEPTIAWWGEKVTGVVIVDPTNGENKFYSRDEIPTWVDRAVPQHYVSYYLEKWGEYNEGWWNSVWAHNNMTKPETPAIVYGSDGDAYWATGITSSNNADESLIGLFYVNSRTGETVKYHAVGSTDDAVLTITDNKVAYRKWHGRSPTLYNLYGVMTAVVPLLGESHTFQGVALVRVDNQQVVEATNLTDALREYQKLLGGSGNQIAPETVHNMVTVEGTVDRFAPEVRNGYTLFYLHLTDVPHLFTGGSDELRSPKLPLTLIGDHVVLSFIPSGEDVVPLRNFDNTTFHLEVTDAQIEVRHEAEARQDQITIQRDAHDARDTLGHMSDTDLQDLMRLRQQQLQAKPASDAPVEPEAK